MRGSENDRKRTRRPGSTQVCLEILQSQRLNSNAGRTELGPLYGLAEGEELETNILCVA